MLHIVCKSDRIEGTRIVKKGKAMRMNPIGLALTFRKAVGFIRPGTKFGIIDDITGDPEKTNEILENLTTTGAAKNAISSLFKGPG